MIERRYNNLKNDEIFFAGVDQFLKEGRTVRLTVKGNSMLPFIYSERDSVVMKRVDDYNVGDIIFGREYKTGRFLLHRVIRKEKGYVILRGDGNLKNVQERINNEDIIGKIVKIIFNNKELDPYSSWQIFRHKIWDLLLPFRRIILAVYRRLPHYLIYKKRLATLKEKSDSVELSSNEGE